MTPTSLLVTNAPKLYPHLVPAFVTLCSPWRSSRTAHPRSDVSTLQEDQPALDIRELLRHFDHLLTRILYLVELFPHLHCSTPL